MNLHDLKLKEHGNFVSMEIAYNNLLRSLNDFDFFTSNEEVDSYTMYHGDPSHWCSLMRREILLGKKPLAIDFSHNSAVCSILCKAIRESGTSKDNFVEFCEQRGLWFFFNFWGCGSKVNKYNIIVIGTECSIYPR